MKTLERVLVLLEGKMKESHSHLFGHVQRRFINEPFRKVESWNTKKLRKGRGKPQMTWLTK